MKNTDMPNKADSLNMDGDIYQRYVTDKIRTGQAAIKQGDTVTSDELANEIERW